MLYVTTRGEREVFTGHWAMTHDPDKGQTIPRQEPEFDGNFAGRTFNQNIAYVLDALYRERISAWDVDMALGKRPLVIADLNSRTLEARLCWGSDWNFEQLSRRLLAIFTGNSMERPSTWFTMSVRIAVLAGVYGRLVAEGRLGAGETMDISVPSDDFQFPMAAWYARKWGVPIGRIICCCNENNAPWALLHQDDLRTDGAPRRTMTSACDQTAPAGLERLLYAVLGQHEAVRYGEAVERGERFRLEASQRIQLQKEMAMTVVSQRRLRFLMPNIYRDGQWTPDPYTAMSYAGLVDHRAHTGETGMGLIISQEDPVFHSAVLERELGITEAALRQRLGRM